MGYKNFTDDYVQTDADRAWFAEQIRQGDIRREAARAEEDAAEFSKTTVVAPNGKTYPAFYFIGERTFAFNGAAETFVSYKEGYNCRMFTPDMMPFDISGRLIAAADAGEIKK